jgi:hypothetical protein
MAKMGRMKEVIRTEAFLFSSENIGNMTKRMTEITMRGMCTSQSWRIP